MRRFPAPLAYERIAEWLATTCADDGDRILRIKGALRTDAHECVAVDAVQHQWDLPRPVEVPADLDPCIIVITAAGSDAGTRALDRLQGIRERVGDA
ncbi:MAG: GTP-binding protein [Halofilum sp. (in: g-proteobacteria)]|nr:GTP-binding protein [Halofilum sp. (in: g-proteobacteria)]